MKALLFLALAALNAGYALVVPVVPTDQMADFLLAKSDLVSELSAWKQSDAGQYAKAHGFMPSHTSRESATDEELRRFFLTKLVIKEAQARNPEAVFSTATPFTLMTVTEFATFIGQSFHRKPQNVAHGSIAVDLPSNATEPPLAFDTDWTTSGCVTKVKNQGQCGSCWAFAAVGALESALCLAGHSLLSLSEQHLVDCDHGSNACQGGFPADALTFIQHSNRVCTEDSYPYVSGTSGTRNSCQPSCSFQTVSIQQVVTIPESETALVHALSSRPVAVGVAAGNAAWKQYQSGIVSACSTSELDHAVLAVGYTSSYFKIKNSWSTQWGESGYMRLKRGHSTKASGTCGIIGPMSVYPQL